MKPKPAWMNLIGALLLIAAIGCADEPEVDTTVVDTESTTETAVEQEVPRLPDGSEATQVVLTNFEIDMPSTLPEGTTLLTVRNDGETEHNLEIEGQGVEKKLDENLRPGEVMTMQVDLVPGAYRVYCPVDDHASRGMEVTLTVTEGAPTTAEVTSDM